MLLHDLAPLAGCICLLGAARTKAQGFRRKHAGGHERPQHPDRVGALVLLTCIAASSAHRQCLGSTRAGRPALISLTLSVHGT